MEGAGRAREKEEMYWREAKGAKSRDAKKHEEEAEKRAEARKLVEMEEKEIEKANKKLKNSPMSERAEGDRDR
ncbi:hypothetical protein FCV25MIE_01553 [Fagus crenata]